MLLRTLVVTAVLLVASVSVRTQKPPAETTKTKPKDAAADINTPRPDATTVTFETTEGTWMSVDVSPDGRTLVFDVLGDLYTLPIEGGTATPLTRGPAYDHHPRFSPDGGTIAFTSDESGMENLWLVDASGRNRRAIVQDKSAYIRSAAWMPDGDYLVARREDAKRAGIPPVELWLFHRLGGTGVKLTSKDELNNAAGPVPSPDGRFIYYATRRGRFSYTPNLGNGLWAIAQYDRTTGETVTLTTGIGGAARPAISPDGRTLVYVTRRDAQTVLVARTLATGAERELARGLTRDDQEGFGAMDVWPNYGFLPDGSGIAYSSKGRLWRLSLANGASPEAIPMRVPVEVALAPPVVRQDRAADGPVRARILRRAHETPDGRGIVFEAFARIWMQPLAEGRPDGAPRRLTRTDVPAREYAPAVSPDGRWVAYVTWSDAEGGHVWKAPLTDAASEPVRLTVTPGHYANPVWAPAGDRLALVRGSGLEFRGLQPEQENYFEIRWMSADGGDTSLVTTVDSPAGMRFHPQAYWNGDGTRLLYGRPTEVKGPDDDPKTDLVSIRPDGTDRQTHLRLPPLDELSPSPDGRWLAFSTRDLVFLTAIPGVQLDTPPEVGTKASVLPVWALSETAGGNVAWAAGSRRITWTLGPAFHTVDLEDVRDFAEAERARAQAKAKADSDKAAAKKDDDTKPRVPPSQSFDIVVELPRPAPEGVVALTGARVITMNGDELLPSADIVVSGSRITAVGSSGDVEIPADAHRFDASGATIIPGLIDTHAHMHYSAFEVFPDTKWEYAANLAYGVTTAYDPSAPSLDVFAQAELIEAGRMIGPRTYSSGAVLYGGQQTPIYAEVDSQEDARRQVRRMKAYGARMIKVYQQPRRDQRLWFAQACREEGMLLTVEGAGELHTDLTTVIDGYTAFEHALPYELHDDVVQLLARASTYYTPTLLVAYGGPTAEFFFYQTRNPHDDPRLARFVPHKMIDGLARRHLWISPDEYHFGTVARGAAAVHRAGGHVALGAHGQLQGLGVHWELWAHAGVGDPGGRPALLPLEALRVATRDAADKLGFLQDLGTIEAGKLADLVVLDADPLADITNTTRIRWVMKNGELFDAASLKSLWPVERDLPRMFWQDHEQTAR